MTDLHPDQVSRSDITALFTCLRVIWLMFKFITLSLHLVLKYYNSYYRVLLLHLLDMQTLRLLMK